MVILKTLEDIEKIKISCKIVAETLVILKEKVKPGITTIELDKLAEEFITDNKATPSFKGYLGYPFTICSSINEEIVHGMPSLYEIKEGDILSIDVGAFKNGFHGDSAITISVGSVSSKMSKLITTGQECLYSGIRAALIDNRIGDISESIQKVAEDNNYGIVRRFVGHGVGRDLHEPPQIPNYIKAGGDKGLLLKQGMVLAIEPMITEGSPNSTVMPNNWTAVTEDGKVAVHWEHTILITKNGPEILTLREDEKEIYACEMRIS
jgi:methionyl aminopeptidase